MRCPPPGGCFPEELASSKGLTQQQWLQSMTECPPGRPPDHGARPGEHFLPLHRPCWVTGAPLLVAPRQSRPGRPLRAILCTHLGSRAAPRTNSNLTPPSESLCLGQKTNEPTDRSGRPARDASRMYRDPGKGRGEEVRGRQSGRGLGGAGI